jgi:hypothetical protein
MASIVYQAIVTKYYGPTNFRGSRIKATAAAASIIMPYRHELNIEDNHAAAAELLAVKMKWEGYWFQGGMPNSSGYCFVNATDRNEKADARFEFWNDE